MLDLRLALLQRLSALVMIPCVLAHLAMMIIAVQGGLSAAEILARTQGSLAWGAFYGVFVIAVATHAAIGLRVIAHEWLGLRGLPLAGLGLALFALLLVTGARAVLAVTMGGAG